MPQGRFEVLSFPRFVLHHTEYRLRFLTACDSRYESPHRCRAGDGITLIDLPLLFVTTNAKYGTATCHAGACAVSAPRGVKAPSATAIRSSAGTSPNKWPCSDGMVRA